MSFLECCWCFLQETGDQVTGFFVILWHEHSFSHKKCASKRLEWNGKEWIGTDRIRKEMEEKKRKRKGR